MRDDIDSAVSSWRDHGFAILPGFIKEADLQPALSELAVVFPSADEFHDRADPERNRRFESEFGGISDFPFSSSALSLLAVDDSLIDLATALLGTPDVRVLGIEAWAKYTGAARYDQEHHRDYLSHSLVAPSTDPRFAVVEMFLYLVDTPVELGPPSVVPRRHSAELPAIPNWYPRADGDVAPDHDTWQSVKGAPHLYEHEVPASGPAGTVVAYSNTTFHRGTELTLPRGARYTVMVNFRPAANDWNTRHSWQQRANSDEWHAFVRRASARQLALFGWPPPGHAYWTNETIAGTRQRYPGLDMTPWIVGRPPGSGGHGVMDDDFAPR